MVGIRSARCKTLIPPEYATFKSGAKGLTGGSERNRVGYVDVILRSGLVGIGERENTLEEQKQVVTDTAKQLSADVKTAARARNYGMSGLRKGIF